MVRGSRSISIPVVRQCPRWHVPVGIAEQQKVHLRPRRFHKAKTRPCVSCPQTQSDDIWTNGNKSICHQIQGRPKRCGCIFGGSDACVRETKMQKNLQEIYLKILYIWTNGNKSICHQIHSLAVEGMSALHSSSSKATGFCYQRLLRLAYTVCESRCGKAHAPVGIVVQKGRGGPRRSRKKSEGSEISDIHGI